MLNSAWKGPVERIVLWDSTFCIVCSVVLPILTNAVGHREFAFTYFSVLFWTFPFIHLADAFIQSDLQLLYMSEVARL